MEWEEKKEGEEEEEWEEDLGQAKPVKVLDHALQLL